MQPTRTANRVDGLAPPPDLQRSRWGSRRHSVSICGPSPTASIRKRADAGER